MNTLVLLFIFWVVSKLLFSKAKERFPNPSIPQQEEEFPTYRLPPDLRGKWGPQGEGVSKTTQVEDIVLAEPPAEPQKYKIARGSQVLECDDQEKAPKVLVHSPALAAGCEEHQYCHQGFLDDQELTPAMLSKGIILSEILGPPVARRRSNRTYYH